MDDNKLKQLTNIKFYVKLKKPVEETYADLNRVYENTCLDISKVKKWYERFIDKGTDIAVNYTPNHIKEVAEILLDPYVSTRHIIKKLSSISKIALHHILIKKLDMSKICERFVPRMLTEDEKVARVEYCRDMLRAAEDSDSKQNDFKENIVTYGETWFHQDEVITKQQDASTLKCQTLPKVRTIKTLLTVFFDSKGIIRKEFIPEDQAENTDYYLGILKCLWNSIHESDIRPEYRKPGSWSLLHDYAPEHQSKNVRSFLAEKGITALDIPSYSPDLAPYDFWLLPKLKSTMKGKRYNNIKDMENNLTADLEKILDVEYKNCFENLFNQRLQCCINSKGKYQ